MTQPPNLSAAATTAPLRSGADTRVRCYSSQFTDLMEMAAPATVVGDYLDHHDGWFRRCAAPMRVLALGHNSYALTLGRFGNFGFEVEPTIALELLPQSEGVYRIGTVPLADDAPSRQQVYDVDFNASLRLESWNGELGPATQVCWDLDLRVWIRLPAVIGLLPESLVQSSGDHLLRQIVRQVSRKLTWKVQEDFHATHDLVCPPRRRAAF
nr:MULTISPECIES: DUF1997 domain-containing protein [unclassified Synechococcus]